MYRNFFSLSDLPFSIAPDPKYLFMSERHKEALSHLTYGQGEVGGFALLTGEVGTGKTTVSRCLIEQLPESTQAAFILNPMLSSVELLATLCDKLEIDYQKDDISLKNLTDKIAEKLLANHESGINTLLIIDEAQHLQPEVLEQLRLLTNLETNTKKLLQVILIGQPELQQLLQRRDLRQLAQRITARYHLMPLTKDELKQYIEHRLTIADCARKIFDNSAITKIHQLSQGVPRLINLLCHSSLMIAYNQNDSIVGKKIVTTAAENVLGTTAVNEKSVINSKNILVLSTVVSVIAFITLASFWWGRSYEPSLNTLRQAQENQFDLNSSPNSQADDSNTKLVPITELMNTEAVNDVSAFQPVPQVKVTEVDTMSMSSSKPVMNTVNHGDIKQTIRQEEPSDLTPVLHTVQQGDTLYSISLKYNTKIKALLAWNNNTEVDDISVGDTLYVSSPKAPDMLVVSSESKTQRFNSKQSTNDNYDIKPVEGVSDDLLALFQTAIDETDTESDNTTIVTSANRDPYIDNTSENIKSISQLSPEQQRALPEMSFEQHIYSSDGEGWVTVNGRDRYEGDHINEYLVVDKILPQKVILSFKGEKFSIPALTNW